MCAHMNTHVPFLFPSSGKDFTSWMVRLWQWSLVRHTAGMLKKRVEDLGPVGYDWGCGSKWYMYNCI